VTHESLESLLMIIMSINYISGSNYSHGYLINRGKTIIMSTDEYEEVVSDDFTLTIPCALNYPVNLTVDLILQHSNQVKICNSL